MIIQPFAHGRVEPVVFRFDARDCIDDVGIFARSYGQKVYGVHTRASVKRVLDQRGTLIPLPHGMPALHRINGEPTILLEPERRNLVTYSEQFDNAAWTKQTGTTVTPNVALGADGALTAALIQHDGSITSGSVNQAVDFTGDGEKVVSWFLREGTGDTRCRISIYDVTAATHRHRARVTWASGVPTLSTIEGSGTLFVPVYCEASGLWRLSISAAGVVAANTNRAYLYVADAAAAVGSVYAGGAQPEDAVVPSSYIRTEGSEVTRATDSLYFPFRDAPKALTLYSRGRNVGESQDNGTNRILVGIGGASVSADPRFYLATAVSSASPQTVFDDGVSPVTGAGGAAGTVLLGDVVERLGTLTSDWRPTAQIAVNGDLKASGASAGPGMKVSAWAAERIYLRSTSAPMAYTHVVVAAGERTMHEMRELAGV